MDVHADGGFGFGALRLGGERDQRALDRVAALEIRKMARDLRNRLHSIHEDSLFARKVADAYPRLALVANLRCGAWYTPPERTAGCSYFKSTDGHASQWAFSLKRSNAHLLGLLAPMRADARAAAGSAEGGAHADSEPGADADADAEAQPERAPYDGLVIVDSTRRGKSTPDALSKTVPIWCAVLNRAARLRWPPAGAGEAEGEGAAASDASVAESASASDAAWEEHGRLATPPESVSASEHDQIASRIEGWAAALLASDVAIPRLRKPLKPFFVTPQTKRLPALPSDVQAAPYHPVLCLSVSRLTPGGMAYAQSSAPSADAGAGSRTFVYMQGAGDDHENWARGLTPSAWWDARNHARLLAAERDDMEDLVDEIVQEQQEAAHGAASGSNAWFVPSAAGAAAGSGAGAAAGAAHEEEADGFGPAARVRGTCVVVRRLDAAQAARFCDAPARAPTSATAARLVVLCDAPPLEEEEGEHKGTDDGDEDNEQSKEGRHTDESGKVHGPTVLRLGLRHAKVGLRQLNDALRTVLATACAVIARDPGSQSDIVVADASGKDLAGAFAVLLLAALYDENRHWVAGAGSGAIAPGSASSSGATAEAEAGAADEPAGGGIAARVRAHVRTLSKDTVRKRCQWLIADAHTVVGSAGPARAILNRVNHVLLDPDVLAR